MRRYLVIYAHLRQRRGNAALLPHSRYCRPRSRETIIYYDDGDAISKSAGGG